MTPSPLTLLVVWESRYHYCNLLEETSLQSESADFAYSVYFSLTGTHAEQQKAAVL